MAFLRCENDHKRCVEEDREYFPCDPCLTLRRIQYLKDLISFFFFFPSLTIKQNPPQGMATLHRIALKLTPPQRFFLFGGFPAGVKNKKNNRERDKNDRITPLMFFFRLLPQIDNNGFLKLQEHLHVHSYLDREGQHI